MYTLFLKNETIETKSQENSLNKESAISSDQLRAMDSKIDQLDLSISKSKNEITFLKNIVYGLIIANLILIFMFIFSYEKNK